MASVCNSDDYDYVYDSDEVWCSCNDFQELLDANIKFLNGEIRETPSHLGPICKESYEILDRLLAINKLGFMSDGSQPSMILDGKFIQRSYITGYIDMRHIFPLVEFMKTQPVFIRVIFQNKILYDNFPTYRYCVTIDKSDEEVDWHECTWMQYYEADEVIFEFDTDKFPNVESILLNCANIQLVSNDWNNFEVVDVLLQFMKTISSEN